MMNRTLVMALAFFLSGMFLYSVETGNSVLKGKIRDSQTKEFVSDLKVLLMGDMRNYNTKTDSEGYFSINGLSRDNYYTINVYRKAKLLCSRRIKIKNNREYISLELNIYNQDDSDTAESVNLTGRIVDARTLMAVNRAYVFLDGGEVFTISDSNGRYFFEDVGPGTHIIKVKSRNHGDVVREIKLAKKEEYLDFELGSAATPRDPSSPGRGLETAASVKEDPFAALKEKDLHVKDEYLNEDLIESGFDEAVKKVVSSRKVESVKVGERAKGDFAVLEKLNDSAPTILGPTGMIDIVSAETLKEGSLNFGVGVFSGSRDTLAGDIDTSLSSFKLVYGFKENVEVGLSNLQKEYDKYLSDNNSQLFHIKYNVNSKGPLQLAVGYSYLNDDVISNNNIINLITQYSFRTGKFLNSLMMNVSTTTDFSNSVSSSVNIGIESKPLFIKYPLSYMLELEQNDDKEFKILNLGLRLKKNPSFDVVYRKEMSSSNQMLGLGSNVRF